MFYVIIVIVLALAIAFGIITTLRADQRIEEKQSHDQQEIMNR